MHLLGVYLSNYYDWCFAFCARNRRWVGYAVVFGSFLGFLGLTNFLPGWINALVLLAMMPFQGLFLLAHHRVWEKRDQINTDQLNRVYKTKKLIDRFKK
ncbi:hypothetical protein RUM8411_02487 [Ruegeria meonggei]|uniref:Uncharacterized protein n=1 Tax=Ruegeria meonggei TaxID=1446476 RepID=A0A1X6ZIA3_9RHOB|nr:hypothetical protein RUM8411_02487 [Ruegeria meonggei]